MRRHALLIGIDRYKDPGMPALRYAERDARELGRALGESCGFDVRVLCGREATREEVLGQLGSWGSGPVWPFGRRDVFLFFFAGHGEAAEGGYVLHTYDARPGGSARSLRVRDLVESARARRCVFILDACRGLEPGFSREGDRDINAAVGRAKGKEVQVLFGCEVGGRSREDDRSRHGALARFLLDELREPDPRSGLTFEDLAHRTAERVAIWSRAEPGAIQSPHAYLSPGARTLLVPPRQAQPGQGGPPEPSGPVGPDRGLPELSPDMLALLHADIWLERYPAGFRTIARDALGSKKTCDFLAEALGDLDRPGDETLARRLEDEVKQAGLAGLSSEQLARVFSGARALRAVADYLHREPSENEIEAAGDLSPSLVEDVMARIAAEGPPAGASPADESRHEIGETVRAGPLAEAGVGLAKTLALLRPEDIGEPCAGYVLAVLPYPGLELAPEERGKLEAHLAGSRPREDVQLGAGPACPEAGPIFLPGSGGSWTETDETPARDSAMAFARWKAKPESPDMAKKGEGPEGEEGCEVCRPISLFYELEAAAAAGHRLGQHEKLLCEWLGPHVERIHRGLQNRALARLRRGRGAASEDLTQKMRLARSEGVRVFVSTVAEIAEGILAESATGEDAGDVKAATRHAGAFVLFVASDSVMAGVLRAVDAGGHASVELMRVLAEFCRGRGIPLRPSLPQERPQIYDLLFRAAAWNWAYGGHADVAELQRQAAEEILKAARDKPKKVALDEVSDRWGRRSERDVVGSLGRILLALSEDVDRLKR